MQNQESAREPPGLAPKLEKVGVAVELRLCRPFIGHPKFYSQHCKLGDPGLLGETHRQTDRHTRKISFLPPHPPQSFSLSHPPLRLLRMSVASCSVLRPFLAASSANALAASALASSWSAVCKHSRGTSIRGGPIPPTCGSLGLLSQHEALQSSGAHLLLCLALLQEIPDFQFLPLHVVPEVLIVLQLLVNEAVQILGFFLNFIGLVL